MMHSFACSNNLQLSCLDFLSLKGGESSVSLIYRHVKFRFDLEINNKNPLICPVFKKVLSIFFYIYTIPPVNSHLTTFGLVIIVDFN